MDQMFGAPPKEYLGVNRVLPLRQCPDDGSRRRDILSTRADEPTIIIVSRGQLVAYSIEYIVKSWVGVQNIIRVETESRLRSAVGRVEAQRHAAGRFHFIVDATAYPSAGNAMVADACTKQTNASVMFFADALELARGTSARISAHPELNFNSSRIKWERVLRRLIGASVAPRAEKPELDRFGRVHGRLERPSRVTLTSRQSEVLDLLIQGMTNKQIAMRMGLAESTIKAYVGELMSHFNVFRRTHLIALSIKGGSLVR